MSSTESEIEDLLDRAAQGDHAAREQLLGCFHKRLRQMVAVHLDCRIAARVDPSDVVQEAMTDAARKLDDYLRERPLPFYPWLRRLAWERLVKLHQHHLRTKKRAAGMENPNILKLPEDSAAELASRIVDSGSSPSRRLLRAELRDRVRDGLSRLPERDREVLVLRYLEQLSTAEIAAVLGIREGAVKVRHLRALKRLRDLLGDGIGESEL
jgi:RNA polymerase sigma-70 factor (ECF subfamily)